MKKETIFSECRKYRYTLWRRVPVTFNFEPRKWNCDYVQFIGLNPSTADELNDDQTIRRCRSFASDWGFGWMCMTNLFAWRDTQPSEMQKQAEPIGAENDSWLKAIAGGTDCTVAAWGTDGSHLGRDAAVKILIPSLYCIRKTVGGFPEHPLRLPKTLTPIPF